MGRVNGLLYALRNGKFKRSPYDTDLLPPEHPDAKADSSLSVSVRHLIDFYKGLERAPKDEGWGWNDKEADKVMGDPPDMQRYRRAFLFVNKGSTKDPKGYKLPIAKMVGDELKIVFRGVVASGTAIRGDQSKAGFSSGYYNLEGATERDKRELYEVIKALYSSFGETKRQKLTGKLKTKLKDNSTTRTSLTSWICFCSKLRSDRTRVIEF